MRRKHTIRILLASGVAVVGVGASATIAIGDTDDPAPVAAATQPPGARSAAATVVRAASGPEFAEFGVRAEDAVEIPAPEGAKTDRPWWVVPADRGACFSPGDGGLVCGTAAQLEAGRIIAVDMPLHQQSDGVAHTDPSTPLRIAGLVPDGVASVVATAGDGRVLGRAGVRSNVYEIPLDRQTVERLPSTLQSVELRRADGTAAATLKVDGNSKVE